MLTIPATRSTRRRILAAALALSAVTVLCLGLYGTLGRSGNLWAACATPPVMAARLDAAATGELAAFQATRRPDRLPALAFRGPDGRPLTLADFAGRTVLLNLWATWCEPCKREMPALDALQRALGGPGFAVAAVNIDTRDVERPRTWLREAGIRHLDYFSDNEARIFQDLRRMGLADGMPTTILVDGTGCRIGSLAGPADWASPEGLGLIRTALGGSDGLQPR